MVRLRDRLLMPENEALEAPVQIRGTAIAQSGEPAGEVPIVVKKPQGISPWPDDLTLADGRTAADGTFVLEFDAGDAKVVQLDFGRKGEANWLIVPVSVEAAEVDLQDVRLHPPVKSALDRDGGVKGAATFTIHGIALDANGSPASDLLVVVKVPNKMLVSANDDPRDGLAAEAEVRPGDHGKRNAVSPPWFAAIGIGMTEPDGSFIVTLSVPNSDAVQVEIGDKWKTAWLIRPVRATDGDQGLGTVRLLPPIADK